MENKTAKNIETLIRARYPLIYIVSFEEGRVINSVTDISKNRNKQLFQWSITEGLQTPDGSYLSEFKDPVKVLEYIFLNSLYLFLLFHYYIATTAECQ